MSASGARQAGYGVLAAVGLITTWFFNLRFSGQGSYLAGWFANDAASSAATDLIVLALAASIFMIAEGHRLGLRWPWVYVLAGFALAMAFAVPLFLLVRERALATGTTRSRPIRPSRQPR